MSRLLCPAAIALQVGLAAAQAAVTVNLGTTYQIIDGFGFSAAFGQAANVQALSSSQQQEVINLLFSTSVGAGFTILRNRIGSGGTGDSIEPNSPGSPSAAPDYVWDGNDSGQVWLTQQARASGVEYVYADAWSAPGFMKTNDNQEDGGYLCGVTGETCASGDWRQAYANFLVQYIKDYASEGLHIDFVGFLNEPEYAATYSSMLSDGTQAASFIPILYETIQSAGLNTSINCCDGEGWTDQVTYTEQMNVAGVLGDLGRITSHWYLSQGTSPMPDTNGLRVWQTEYAYLGNAYETTWYSNGGEDEGLYWANQIYQGIVTCELSAFLQWWGPCSNADSSCLIQMTGGITPSGRLWAYGMWSRYIRPNAIRLGTTGAPSNVLVAAFKNTDGSVPVLFINNGESSESITVSLEGGSIGSVAAWVMDNSVSSPSTLAGVTVSNGQITTSLPGYSVVTLVITTSGSSGGGTTTTSTTISTATTTTTPPPRTTTTTTTSSSGLGQTEWEQCGGIGWTGPSSCDSPYACSTLNPYYAQCL